MKSDFPQVYRGNRAPATSRRRLSREKGLWPHHIEHELCASGMLFANGFSANRNLLFDLTNPRVPKVVERFDGAGD